MNFLQKLCNGNKKSDKSQRPSDPLGACAESVQERGVKSEAHPVQPVWSYTWYVVFSAQALHGGDQRLGRQFRKWGLTLEEIADLIGREHAETLASALLSGKPSQKNKQHSKAPKK